MDWTDLTLSERWSARKRFNLIMAYIDDAFSEEETVEETIEDVETGNIAVKVSLEGNQDEKIANAHVVITKDSTEYGDCTTGTQGGCSITNVPYGEYSVTATCEGYDDYTGTFTVESESQDLEISLSVVG